MEIAICLPEQSLMCDSPCSEGPEQTEMYNSTIRGTVTTQYHEQYHRRLLRPVIIEPRPRIHAVVHNGASGSTQMSSRHIASLSAGKCRATVVVLGNYLSVRKL